MEMPPIHMCAFLSHENERLKQKIIALKRQRSDLQQRIAQRTDDHARSCSISCQTDIDLGPRRIHHPPSNQQRISAEEHARLHRLLEAQNELLRKYEAESVSDRQNPQPSSTVIENYRRRLQQCEREKQQAEQRAKEIETRLMKIEERYEKMRREMSVLDENFFEDIEDLKYALQQATNLNREYEKTVQMLSTRLGIPYPKVEVPK